MSKSRLTFMQKCLAGEALADEVDDFVDRWHEGEGDPEESLADFLGLSNVEYRLWAEKPHLLPLILDARRNGAAIDVRRGRDEPCRPAAEGISAEDVEELTRWLKLVGEPSN